MKKIIYFILSLLFGLMFVNAGLNKLFEYIPVSENMPEKMVKLNEAFIEIGWLIPLLAIVEIVGGLLFIIPKTRLLGALIIFPVMIGILITHFTVSPSGIPVALVLFAINCWVFIENKDILKQIILKK